MEEPEETEGSTSPRVVGLISPMPPRLGGVASVSEWLVEHERELGCRYVVFELVRSPSDARGGRFRARAVLAQLRLLLRYSAWLPTAPRYVHYAVALTPGGLARDTLFVLLARLLGRRVIAHVHGADHTVIRPGTPRALALRVIGKASVQAVTLAPSLAARLGALGMPATSILNPVRSGIAPVERARVPQPSPLRVLFAGTYGQRKGSPDLVRAIAHARAQGVDATLVLAGEEEHLGEESALRQLVRELGIEAAVSFPGVVARERLGTLYAESSVFCLPSYREGLPMALLEAMALGLPSITTSVGGIGDVVEHDVSGLLVKPGDVDALAAAIERLASDPELARRLGAGAQERIRSMAGEEVIAEQWRELYARYVRS